VHVWYGPDTYMGHNLQELFASLARMPDAEVAAVHPSHSAASVAQCLPRLHAYPHGTCIVHHIFGGETAEAVRRGYGDAYITAHFEVPGEMFGLAMEAQRQRGMGVVGSTSNILDFIAAKVQAAQGRGFQDRLQVVLGTETGMVTSIVRKVQSVLAAKPDVDLEVEIVFPVAAEAIMAGASAATGRPVELPGGLAVVPGPAGGEGCSSEGGCAACPYMKMNSLEALERVCSMVGEPAGEALLQAYMPEQYKEKVRPHACAFRRSALLASVAGCRARDERRAPWSHDAQALGTRRFAQCPPPAFAMSCAALRAWHLPCTAPRCAVCPAPSAASAPLELRLVLQIGSRPIVEAGCEPILHMRAFQQSGQLPSELVHDIVTRQASGGGP
jgi:Quinolinate synthetase A protein